MSDTTVEDLAPAVAGINIDGPRTDDDRPTETEEEHAAPGEDDAPADEDPPTATVSVNGGPEMDLAGLTTAALKDALFDSDTFIDVPVMDGQATDCLKIKLAGGVEFESTNAHGKAIFEALTLGKSVDLQVSGHVAMKQGQWKENAKGEEVVTGSVGIKIDSITVLRPEDL